MKFATTSVEFSFNNIMYRQIDGIYMGSVLGSTMSGIFVGFHEVGLFSKFTVLYVYVRYVDDTFCIFGSETEAGKFYDGASSYNADLFTILSRPCTIARYGYVKRT